MSSNPNSQGYSQDDCLEALQQAAEYLSGAPTISEYRELGYSPSAKTMENKFGSWSQAKREAGLEVTEHGQNEAFINRRESLQVDSQYFRVINTPEKAYWLGFSIGDGCMRRSDNNEGLSFSIEIHEADKKLLESFKEAVGARQKLCHRPDRPHVYIRIRNRRFCKHLWNWGVTPNKTHDGFTPILDEEYRPAFVRGLLDSDGHINNPRDGGKKVRLSSSSKGRLSHVNEWLPVDGDVRKQNIHYLCVYGKRAIRLLKWLYPNLEDTSPALTRKKDRAVTHLNG